MLPGVSGFRWMPRKMAGMATITIEASIVAIVMLSVVLDRATHRYVLAPWGEPESPPEPPALGGTHPPEPPLESRLSRTLTQSTAKHLLNGNYLPGHVFRRPQRTGSSSPPESGPAGELGVRSTM